MQKPSTLDATKKEKITTRASRTTTTDYSVAFYSKEKKNGIRAKRRSASANLFSFGKRFAKYFRSWQSTYTKCFEWVFADVNPYVCCDIYAFRNGEVKKQVNASQNENEYETRAYDKNRFALHAADDFFNALLDYKVAIFFRRTIFYRRTAWFRNHTHIHLSLHLISVLARNKNEKGNQGYLHCTCFSKWLPESASSFVSLWLIRS